MQKILKMRQQPDANAPASVIGIHIHTPDFGFIVVQAFDPGHANDLTG